MMNLADLNFWLVASTHLNNSDQLQNCVEAQNFYDLQYLSNKYLQHFQWFTRKWNKISNKNYFMVRRIFNKKCFFNPPLIFSVSWIGGRLRRGDSLNPRWMGWNLGGGNIPSNENLRLRQFSSLQLEII